MNNYLRRVM